MMSEQDLADVVQIAVEDLTPDHPGTVGVVASERSFGVFPINKWSFSSKYKPVPQDFFFPEG